jgi:dihydroorotase
MSLQILNGRLIDPANGLDGVTDLFVGQGRVAGIGAKPAGFRAQRTLEAGGRVVIPGLVDLAARTREPGLEHKATILTETRAAAAGGITTLCCPPDTDPVVDSPAEIKLIQQRARDAGYARICSLAALTQGLEGKSLSEMAALKQSGCVGVSNAWQPLESTLVLRRAMEYAASQGLTVFLHPLDHALADLGCVHEGALATRLGLPGIPAAAETAALGQQLALVEQTGVRTHFCRLSTARAARMVARARHDGLPVSADACAHQLFLTEADVADYNSLCHTLPPLRTPEDREGLRRAVADGAVAAICSDHQPHELDAKRAPFAETEPGISALETLLPLTLSLVREGVLDLPCAISRLTRDPAAILELDRGTLSVGARADICIYDPHEGWQVEPTRLLSQGKNSPFLGWTFTGRVTHTLLGGRIVYQAEAR